MTSRIPAVKLPLTLNEPDVKKSGKTHVAKEKAPRSERRAFFEKKFNYKVVTT